MLTRIVQKFNTWGSERTVSTVAWTASALLFVGLLATSGWMTYQQLSVATYDPPTETPTLASSLSTSKPATSVTNQPAPPAAGTPQTSPATAPPKAATAPPTTVAAAGVAKIQGMQLYVEEDSYAKQQAATWRSSRPADAAQMDKLAAIPMARWFGDWDSDIRAQVAEYVNAAAKQSSLPVLVAYNIPGRDCGSYSAGGTSVALYPGWIKSFAAGIGSNKALVILEPDAVAGLDCLSTADKATRLNLIKQAVATLGALPNTSVYIDAGNSGWHTADTMASRLIDAGIGGAQGFALNVSNFFTTAQSTAYGQQLSAKVGGKHFIIDTSRNGLGSLSGAQWCNPPGRALGERPTTNPSNPLIDALLFVKRPGESDGTCNGGPASGSWWPEYALGLAQRAAY